MLSPKKPYSSDLKTWCKFCKAWDSTLKLCNKHRIPVERFNWCDGCEPDVDKSINWDED